MSPEDPKYRFGEEPVLEKPLGATFALEGYVGDRLDANLKSWLLTAPRANPAMLEMFRDRDLDPPRDWAHFEGEFVGKYLISAVLGWRMARDEQLKRVIDEVVEELIDAQGDDGYLGPFEESKRLTSGKWDVWGHYHWMQALLMYHDDTGHQGAVEACRKTSDLIHRTFVGTGVPMQSPEQNLSILHSACLLYEHTRHPRDLELAEWVIEESARAPKCGYMEDALAGKPIQDFRCRRWENLPCIQGICELGFITGDPVYGEAFERIWWAMLEGDRHNTGGFTSGEAFQGNPYDQRSIETCCTIAWVAVTVDMLRRTGDSRIADELELSLYNGVLGAQHPSGRWWTYNTPMDGQRKASAHSIVGQARPGSPELNCCSVNGPRGIGMLSEWAVMTASDGLAVNYYGPGSVSVVLPSGRTATLQQETEYPLGDRVRLTVGLEQPETFALKLRIPQWSSENEVCINGGSRIPASRGAYHVIERTWEVGDSVDLSLDLSGHFWAGERELAGQASLYRGPVLLTYDWHYNDAELGSVPAIDAADAVGGLGEPLSHAGWIQPWMLCRCQARDGGDVFLCDYASAGETGTAYRSWLPIEGVSTVAFTRDDPMRIVRA